MRFPIIDAHMHLGANAEYVIYDDRLESLLKRMDALEIERAISAHMLSLADDYEAGLNADKAAHEASGGRIYSFFCFGPRRAQAALAAIRARRGDPVFRAIKIHPAWAATDADSEAYRPVWDIAKALRLPIMAHTWDVSAYNPSQKAAYPAKFEKYIAEYPEVTFVFGHAGGRYHGFLEVARIMRAHKNCYCDIAGDIWANGALEYLVESVGPDRILYGSDCYMIEQRPMLGVVLGADIPVSAKEKILRYNALNVYFSDCAE